jgi:hypothetical protein
MDQEDFLSNLDWLQQLKLRLGVGLTGNAAVGPYDTLGAINSYYVPFGGASDAILYVPNEPYYTANLTPKANPNLGWEKTTQWNLGLDFSILKGRIGGTIDFYTSKTDDLLMYVSIPTITGYANIWDNIGKTKSKGVDLSLNFVPVEINGFTWSSNFNATWSTIKIVELAYGENDMVGNLWFIGKSLNVYYGYENGGLWQESDTEEMAKWTKEKFSAGMVKPVDKNGNYEMDDEDRVVFGTRDPKWVLGWSNTFNYKGLELNIEMGGRMGYIVNAGSEAQGGPGNQRKIDYWTPENPVADWQKPIWTATPGVSGDPYAGLLGYKKASYIKVRNVSLGYFLPKNICKPAGISNLKLYAQLRNPGNIYSTVDYLDLDLGESTSFYNRGVTFGIDVTF